MFASVVVVFFISSPAVAQQSTTSALEQIQSVGQGLQQERRVPDKGDGLVIQGTPRRVVVLEYSFLDAVVLAGITPVGIADDQKPQRILSQLKQQMGDYQSVGLRGQPNLETIASLKPDLIIADQRRHSGIYRELQGIAPTLLLLSYGAEYNDLLNDAVLIGQALGKQSYVEQRLQQHETAMDRFRVQLKSAQLENAQLKSTQGQQAQAERFLFATASERGVAVHASKAFATGVIHRLGLQTAIPQGDNSAYMRVSFEQMAGMNPDWLLVGDYNRAQGGAEALKRWQAHPLWPMLNMVKKQQLKLVDPKVWSLSRGIFAAEQIAEDLIKLVSASPLVSFAPVEGVQQP
ncbi:ABC transporter substrate-binding protein [Oceanospirillum beijerinckii]|uniref:ABC transporter substrate-binding protein n=1 Tax=Oceanospirillum beijerinckii TaxID=64976 RepID=UPI0012FECFF8|nr:Fe(3+) dicitrate ABC transporter substrate-binding protein [Oceanospirillum beijerinckii]